MAANKNVAVQQIDIPKVSVPKVTVPEVKTPDIALPEIKMPKVEVPKVEMKNEVAEDTNRCPVYLTTYHRVGESGDEQGAKKIARFLNRYQNAGLSEDGVYSQDDAAAVVAFQEAHRAEVLTPWGLDSGSGYVYKTTQDKINDIYCDEMYSN